MSKDQYSLSWKLYKAHSSLFNHDLDFYLKFCGSFKSLEIFSGYGRVTNYLQLKKSNIYANEQKREFANFIQIPDEKKFVCDFFDMPNGNSFERIFCAYNSFALITEEHQIFKFFHLLDYLLKSTGKISLSYSHPCDWHHALKHSFKLDGKPVFYEPCFDLENLDCGEATWIDKYIVGNKEETFSYNVKVYDKEEDLRKYLKGTSLKIVDVVKEFNKPNEFEEQGWIDYILQKS